MTGLYEKVSKLQDDSSLTFLYKAPKITIEPLNINAVAASYETNLNVSEEKAMEFTNGYAYAYQDLGHILYEKENKDLTQDVLVEFDQYMADYVYDKLFSELSPKEQKIILSFKTNTPLKAEEISRKSEIDPKSLSVYRDRLIKKGILVSPAYGYVRFAFPRFAEYLRCKSDF